MEIGSRDSRALPPQHSLGKKRYGKRFWLIVGLVIGIILLLVMLIAGIMLGAAEISPQTVIDAIFHYDESLFEHLIIQTVRLPRVLAGAIAGASLAVAGAIMQGVTRNPLASPAAICVIIASSWHNLLKHNACHFEG